MQVGASGAKWLKRKFKEGRKEMENTYQHSIDTKGRLFIPVRLREELGQTFYVTLSMEKCLSAYSGESWKRFKDKKKEMPQASQKLLRPLFAMAAKCELDSQGRINIPQALRDFAGLKKNVAVVGVGDCVQLWDSDTYAVVAAEEMTPENIAAVFEKLDF